MKMLEQETPRVITFWRPDFGMYTAVLWTQVEEGEYNAATIPKFYPNGSIALLTPVSEQGASTVKELMAAWEEDTKDESTDADVLNAEICTLSEASINASLFQDGNGTFVDRATIPTTYAMVSSDCALNCSTNVHVMGAFTEDTEFTFKLSLFEEWVNDVKRVVQIELAESGACPSPTFAEYKICRLVEFC